MGAKTILNRQRRLFGNRGNYTMTNANVFVYRVFRRLKAGAARKWTP